ncbi:MAG TPA: hypothetical protein VHC69_20420 [Polyangiaceae bacterium]|nr:hypothetical protein [Polyangiaceae bacterium]
MKIRNASFSLGSPSCVAALALTMGIVGCGSSNDGGSSSGAITGAGGTPSGVPTATPGAGAAVTTPPAGSGATGAVTPPASGAGGTTSVGGPPAGTGATPAGGPPAGTGGSVITPPSGTAGAGGVVGAGGAAPAGGAPNGGAAGSTGTDPSQGCGQGTFCMAGSDLAPPDAADGVQFVSPSSINIQPGGEQFWCYYKNMPPPPGGGATEVGGFKSWMTAQSSHHFITFLGGAGSTSFLGGFGGGVQPDGSLQQCSFGAGQWAYATSKSGLVVGMNMPDGVGLEIAQGQQFIMNMHLINTGDAPVTPVVKLNVYYAQNVKYKAAAMASFNVGINVPPMGTQTVRGTCTPPAGSNFWLLTTHTHKFATAADVNYVTGGQTTNLVHTTDWENPGTHTWDAPNFLTTKAGDTFTYSCTYSNPTSTAVTVGETAAHNEMCMAIGYFFPAPTGTAGTMCN